ncbi:MAG: penicillin-binding protein activator [bacterium]
MVRLRAWCIVILVALLPIGSVAADRIDDADDVVSLYARGKRQMHEGDWYRAARTFESLAGQFPESSNLDLFLFQQAKSRYYLGELSAALAIFDNYLDRYATVPEAPYAHYFRANVNYRQGQLDQALYDYLRAYRLSQDSRLDELAIASITKLIKNATTVHIVPDDFAALPTDRRCRAITECAGALMDRGEVTSAQNLLQICGQALSPTDPRLEVGRRSRRGVQVAMILPFSGELRSWAEDIYNGAVIAVEMDSADGDNAISLVSFDSQSDPVEAARLIGETAQSSDYLAAVGPLTSEAAAVATATLACRDLPLIVPAATQAGLSSLAPTAFQLSPNIGLQGVVMARYAIDSLRARTAAIITSTSPDYLRMARAFSETFEQLGGSVRIIEYYRPRDKDLGPYLRDLKATLLGYQPDSAFYISPDGDTLDPDGVPVSLDCLYIPGESEQLRLLLPQVRFYKIFGAYLGSDGWGDDVVYRLGDDVTRGAVFPSPFLGTGNSPEYHQFAAAYDARYGGRPPRLACLGFDAVRLLAEAVKDGPRSRRAIAERLGQTNGYAGASGNITFGRYGENLVMPLYRIQNGEAALLEHPATAMPDGSK